MREPIPSTFLPRSPIMRSLVPLASLLCLLAACSSELDAGTNNGGAGGTSPGAGGTSNQAGQSNAGGAGEAGAPGSPGGQAGEGGTHTAGNGPGDGGTSAAGGDGGGGGSAGSGGSSAAGQGGSGAAGSAGAGTARIVHLSFGPDRYKEDQSILTPPYQNNGRASVDPEIALEDAPGCTVTHYGDCHLFACSEPQSDQAEVVDLGDVLFTGAAVSPIALVRAPNATTYQVLVPPEGAKIPTTQPLFKGGAQIQVTGGGGAVPAFDISLEAPSPIRVDGRPVPPATPGSSAEIDTTKDLVLSLLESGVGELYTFIAVGSQSLSSSLVCQTPATAPVQVIPAAALAKLKEASSDSVAGMFHSTMMHQTGRIIEGWKFNLALKHVVLDKNGALSDSEVSVHFK